jgi:hypothetical protein
MSASSVPLHTRMITLRIGWGAGGAVRAEGRIFDLRKRGIVPLAGKLQGPGVVHDMGAQVLLEYPSLLEELEVRPRRAEGPHAAVDSCHMWRKDGPLVSAITF